MSRPDDARAMAAALRPRALEGLLVLDLSRLLPGPFATQLLGAFGARVIKVEEPGAGDYLRQFEPRGQAESGRFLAINRNKESLTLNLKSPEGLAIVRRLAAKADVLVESFRPGVMERLGLGYEALAAENPRLVYCSISGYGQDGPLAQEPAHDLNFMALTGVLDFMRPEGAPPFVPGLPIGDIGAGTQYGLIGILLALQARERSGRGQYVDVSMYDGMLAWMGYVGGDHFSAGAVPGRAESDVLGGAPNYAIYQTADGRWLAVGAFERKFWRVLCDLLGEAELAALDPAAPENRQRARQRLEAIFARRTLAEWEAHFAGSEACVSPCRTFAEAVAAQHSLARGLVVDLPHPVEGNLSAIAVPLRLAGTPAEERRAPPLLGEDSAAILGELGYDTAAVARLRADGVI